MTRRFVVAGAIVAGVAGVAQAQTRAVEVNAALTHREPGVPAGVGIELAYGPAGQLGGRSGSVWRLEDEVCPIFDRAKLGAVLCVQPGLEVWSSGEDDWGFSMPLAIVAGVRAFPFRMVAGAGVDAILVDQVADDTGVGMYAPFALAKVGFDIEGFQAGIDGRIGYRWQLGAEDHGRWQLGMFIAKTFSPPPRRRAPVAVAR